MEQAEIDALVKAFTELGVKPKADSAASLVGWMVDYVSSQGLEQKPVLREDTKPARTLPPQDKLVAQRTIPPKVAAFSGEEGKDADYDLWRFEVNCLQTSGTFEEAVILHQVRKSLRGAASRVAMRLGDKASLRDLLSKLDDLYGNIQLPEELLAEFYNAKQREKETVVAWSCRLEDILIQAQQQGKVTASVAEEMLRTKFWTGLKPILKEKSRHKVDSIKDFDMLRIELRKVEAELLKESGFKSVNKVQVAKEDKPSRSQSTEADLKALQHQVVNLQQQLNDWKNQQPPSTPVATGLNAMAKPYKPPQHAPYQTQPPPLMQPTPNQSPDYPQSQSYAQYSGPQQQYGGQQQSGHSYQYRGQPQCYRCHQYGHIARNCSAIGDHLNPRRPMYSSGRTWVQPNQPQN